MKTRFNRIFTEKWDAIGVVEIILILVILIGLVLIFKDQITAIINKAFEAIAGDSSSIIE